MQPTNTILFIDVHSSIPYENITLSVYLTNPMFKQLLTLLFFFSGITNINNTLNI